jgi:hypothetical protein
MKLRSKHSIQPNTEWLLATTQNETSFTQKVSMLILKSGAQVSKRNAKSGNVNMPKRRPALWHTASRRKRQKLPMPLLAMHLPQKLPQNNK